MPKVRVRTLFAFVGIALCSLIVASGEARRRLGGGPEVAVTPLRVDTTLSASVDGKLHCRLYFGCTPVSRSRTRETRE